MLKFVLMIALIGCAIYVTVRLFEARRAGRPLRRPPRPEPRVTGPDDDPDFLREIDKRKRQPEDPDASG